MSEVAIIGAGPAGYVCAIKLAQFGHKVILIEERDVGGVCLNEGCIPTKGLLNLAKIINDASAAKEFGVQFDEPKIDLNKIKEWNENLIERLRKGIEFLLQKNGVELVKDRAIIEEAREVKLLKSNKKLKVDKIVIATGAKPSLLKNVSYDRKIVWTSQEALRLEKVPEKLLVIGAGAIGLELATIYAQLGSAIIFVELTNQILPGLDYELAHYLKKILEKKGIVFYLNSNLEKVDLNKKEATILSQERGEVKIGFDNLLIAVGRKPRSDELNLSKLKIETDQFGFIKTDRWMMSEVEDIYAIGDVRCPPLLAHKAMYEGIKVAEIISNVLQKEKEVFIPNCIYTEPEIASIGFSEIEAKNKGYDVSISRVPLSAIGRAFTIGKIEGFLKIIYSQKERKILGFHLIMPHASELIGEASIILNCGLKIEEIKDIIHPHPTLSEIISEGLLACLKEAIHIINR